MLKSGAVIPEVIEQKILLVRGRKVMLSFHLAEIYGVETKALLQGVKRNSQRFPEDFMFQLTWEETNAVRSQFVTLDNRGGRVPGRSAHLKYRPFAFTQEGVAMLSTILRSERAIEMNIAIMRTFVKLREILSTHKELAQKLKDLEQRVESHDVDIHDIFEAIHQLMAPPENPKRRIGFDVE